MADEHRVRFEGATAPYPYPGGLMQNAQATRWTCSCGESGTFVGPEQRTKAKDDAARHIAAPDSDNSPAQEGTSRD